MKQWATLYVEGFNAARKEKIGIASLAQDAEASERIDGDHLFSIPNGYGALLDSIVGRAGSLRRIGNPPHLPIDAHVRLNAVVERVQWKPGSAALDVRFGSRREAVHCRQVIFTLPLALLKAEPDGMGPIHFNPAPGRILEAAACLESGLAWRVTLWFESAFWERREEFSKAVFFYSQERVFPTWWKPVPAGVPVITGWSSGATGDDLAALSPPDIVRTAMATLERIVGMRASALHAAHFHDWQADPFSRGTYSYAPTGKLAARATLAQPVCGTLYFAGEATETEGHSATVHGAIASGRRAAWQVLADRKK